MGRLYQKGQKRQQRPASPQQAANRDQEFQFCHTVASSHSPYTRGPGTGGEGAFHLLGPSKEAPSSQG